jgi:hypothetical protein
MTTRRTNYPGSALLAATTLVVAACSSGGGGYGGDDMPTPAANTPPVLSAITDRTVDQDTVLGPIEFGIDDRESGAGALTVTAVADGTSVFPADGVVLGGSGTARTLTLTPLEAVTGFASITVTLRDPQGLIATRTFRVNVNARTASMREAALTTFAKAESDPATSVNGYTFAQDADDPAIFEPLLGSE